MSDEPILTPEQCGARGEKKKPVRFARRDRVAKKSGPAAPPSDQTQPPSQPAEQKAPSIIEHLTPGAAMTVGKSDAIELEKLLASVAFIFDYVCECGSEDHVVGSAFLLSIADVLREGAEQAGKLFDIKEVVTNLGVPYERADEFLDRRPD